MDRLARLHLLVGIIGVLAPVATFILAVSNLSYQAKIAGLGVVALVSILICIHSYLGLRRNGLRLLAAGQAELNDGSMSTFDSLIEASEFLGSIPYSAEIFDVVSNRVRQLVPFDGCLLFSRKRTDDELRLIASDPGDLPSAGEIDFPKDGGLANLAFKSAEVEIDNVLRIERDVLPAALMAGIKYSAAIPLIQDDRVFGVYQIFLRSKPDSVEKLEPMLTAISRKISPLFLGSALFQETLSTALSDSLTGLPNETAFRMILENQLAESARFRDERPLSLLAIDIREFDAVNDQFGQAAGDRVLRFVADNLKKQLRQMDFLARTQNDEFVIVLPTATAKVTAEVADRISTLFTEKPYDVNEHESVKLWLNFGASTFWHDGDTAEQLLRQARLRKQQAKAESPAAAVRSPKEYVN